MSDILDLEARLAEVVDHHERHGLLPPDLTPEVAAMAARYLELGRWLDKGAASPASSRDFDSGTREDPSAALPSIEGFRTIERLGTGGMGEVYKLQDLQLDRIVAAKIIRRDEAGQLSATVRDFLREAKSLALFSDPRIVQIFECRLDSDPAVIIMEFVDGFELGRLAPSLEFRQRAKVMRDVADAVGRAHTLGIQHRDLKPSNIMLDAALTPKILDFGLSDHDPTRGHLRGTMHYVAPEQLDPAQPIDRRTDVYAIGVILYELLCGVPPYRGNTTAGVLEAVRRGEPRLPVEVAPDVPQPLQAIALKAMELRPADRYQTAEELARDLDRYLNGQPIIAHPTQYATTLGTRVRPHLDQIGDWLRLKLIYPHEAARLTSAYKALEAPEADWIVSSRALSYSQIALYLGAVFLFAGSLFYFVADVVHDQISDLKETALVLGLPFVGLNLAGRWLYRRDHQAVAVAFYLAGVSLLPLLMLIGFHEKELLKAIPGSVQFFTEGWISNRQLQVAAAITCAWSGWLAFRTRTGALSTMATLLICVLALAVLADYGLRQQLDQDHYDWLALRVWPLVLVYGAAGYLLERGNRSWFARPSFVAGALTLVVALDLLAIDGRLFTHLYVPMSLFPDDSLFPMLAALTLNGTIFYAIAAGLESYGSGAMTPAARLLFVIAPFSMLEPLAYLSEHEAYDKRYGWLYLGLAVGIAFVSHRRQRKSFYYAGVINSAVALYIIADRYDWLKNPRWAISVVVVGLVALVAGFLADAQRRRAR